jgi:hypothetical protein
MHKGMFSQGLSVLTSAPVSLDEMQAALVAFSVLGRPKMDGPWQFSGPTLIIDFRTEANGKVAVDFVNRAWPDSMGDPKKDPTTFGAWGMGQFGPHTFPGNLERAGQHSWNWEPGKTIAKKHTGFIRVRSSYCFGAKDDTPVLPENYDPLAEMEFLTSLAKALLEMPQALCYFNPGGEVLRDAESFAQILDFSSENDLVPLPAWMNVRFFKLNAEWFCMDTVGNQQLDMPDIEAIFTTAEHEPGQIDNYLRNVTLYLLQAGADVLKEGEAIDGPNERNLTWRVQIPEQPLSPAPRPVLRLFPAKQQRAIKQILNS